MKEVLKRGMLKFENSFFSHVVRCALGMIIPLVLTGGISCAVRDFPVAPYQMFLTQGGGRWFYDFLATVYKGNIIKNLIMDCQSYTKYRPNETTGGIFVSWRRKEELPTGA